MKCSSLRCAQTFLGASNAFVLQDSDDDAPVVSLTFGCGIGCYLPARTHGARSKDVRQRNMTLLFKEIGYFVSSFGAEFLIQGCRSHCGGIAFHLNHVPKAEFQ